MFVLATDPDRGNNGSVVYDIIKNSVTVGSKQDYFVIDRQSGLIKTNVHQSDLDRETIPSFTLEVRASDEGKPPLNRTATITISLNDINDQKPVFDPKIYRTEMSEHQKTGEVFRVGATDADMGNNAKLTYRLADRDSKFFQIITIDNMGSILVYGVSGRSASKSLVYDGAGPSLALLHLISVGWVGGGGGGGEEGRTEQTLPE